MLLYLNHTQMLPLPKGEIAQNLLVYFYLIDLLNITTTKINRPINNTCILCSDKQSIKELNDELYNESKFKFNVELDKISNFDDFTFFDIRSPEERKLHKLNHPKFKVINLNNESDLFEINKSKKIVLICSKGIRSKNMTLKLREKGLNNVYSLQNGLN